MDGHDTLEARARARAVTRALDEAPLTPNTWRMWFLAAMGVFLDGFDLFIMGVAIPLLVIEFDLSPFGQAMIAGAAVFGAVLGAFTLGHLSDRIGRARLFRIDLALFIVFATASALSWDVGSLFAFRFLLGIAIGAEYPLSSSVVSEAVPARLRGRMLVGSFSFQAFGALAGALVGVAILRIVDNPSAWRWLLVAGVVPAVIVAVLRRAVPESPRWLAQQGHLDEAEEAAAWVLRHPVPPLAPDEVAALADAPPTPRQAPYGDLFTRRWARRTTFTSVPWFLMDIATYGIGMFTPTVLAALIVANPDNTAIADDIASTDATAFVDLFLVAGFVLAIVLVDRLGRVRLQIAGFAGMATGMVLLAAAGSPESGDGGRTALVFLGFFLFNLLMNMGPNATTFLLPAEVFPTELRATGHGFAAGFGKVGACVGIVAVPFLQDGLGVGGMALVMAGVCALGALVTAVFRVETMGRSLEQLAIGGGDASSVVAPSIE